MLPQTWHNIFVIGGFPQNNSFMIQQGKNCSISRKVYCLVIFVQKVLQQNNLHIASADFAAKRVFLESCVRMNCLRPVIQWNSSQDQSFRKKKSSWQAKQRGDQPAAKHITSYFSLEVGIDTRLTKRFRFLFHFSCRTTYCF